MKSILFKSGKAEVFVEGINVIDPGNWKIVQEENYKPDREGYIVNAFNKKFPQFLDKGVDYKMVTDLASRATLIGDWLALTNATYAIDEEPPLYVREVMTPEVYISTVANLKLIKVANATKINSDSLAALAYSAALQVNKKAFVEATTKYKLTNEVKILNLTTSDLPITMQMAIMAYTPADASETPNSKIYAREIFVQYKLALLRCCKANPNIDIDLLIEDLKKE